MKDHPLVTCLKCKRVSFSLSKSEAEKEVESFNSYFKTLTKKQKSKYGGKKSTLKQYSCISCGSRDFRLYDSDIDANINGSTINPVVWEG